MSDRILLKGNSKLLKPIITQLLATHQLLENLDIESGGGDEKEMLPGRRYHPQIRIYFRQDTDFVRGTNSNSYKGRDRTSGRLTFRLMNETSETISKTELTNIATKIKSKFGSNNGYIWNKGKELYCYADWSKGYQLQMLTKSQSQARQIVSDVLSLQGHTPTWTYLTRTENTSQLEAYPEIPVKKIILGQETTLARMRPLVTVRFTYAEAKVHRLVPGITLYDRRGKKANALVS